MSDYEGVRARARRHPARVDFRTRAYAPYDIEAVEEDEAPAGADRPAGWRQVLARARAARERCYVRIAPRLYAAAACEALGDGAGRRPHEACTRGLLAAIMSSGGGGAVRLVAHDGAEPARSLAAAAPAQPAGRIEAAGAGARNRLHAARS